MPYICTKCPNKTEFDRDASGREYFNVVQYIDQHGDYDDEGEKEWCDSEIDDYGEIRCAKCKTNTVEDVDVTTWEEWEGPEEELKRKAERERELANYPVEHKIELAKNKGVREMMQACL